MLVFKMALRVIGSIKPSLTDWPASASVTGACTGTEAVVARHVSRIAETGEKIKPFETLISASFKLLAIVLPSQFLDLHGRNPTAG